MLLLLQFNLYNMRRTWLEGISSHTVPAPAQTGTPWMPTVGGRVGIASTLDRYSTNLWSATTTSFTATGSRTEALQQQRCWRG